MGLDFFAIRLSQRGKKRGQQLSWESSMMNDIRVPGRVMFQHGIGQRKGVGSLLVSALHAIKTPDPFSLLGGMHTKLCGQLRQRFLAFDRGESHLCLKGRPLIASRSLHRLAPWFAPLGVGLSKATTYHTVRISGTPSVQCPVHGFLALQPFVAHPPGD